MRCIGKLVTTRYKTSKGFASKREFIVLKRKSQLGINDFIDDLEYCIPINFYDVEDGVYELDICNISKDWETCIIDDWDVKLIPYKEKDDE